MERQRTTKQCLGSEVRDFRRRRNVASRGRIRGSRTSGFDYALADTQGGSSGLNNTIIASSNFLLIPTMLTPLDIDEALSTYRYVIELLIGENLVIPTAVLRQHVPVGRLTTSQRAMSDIRMPVTAISPNKV